MNEEDLYYGIINWSGRGSTTGCVETLDKFFKTNVCTPKGENPHQYSKILHELAENRFSCETRIDTIRPSNVNRVQINFSVKNEPDQVYEYLWKFSGALYGEEISTHQYKTDEEMCNLPFIKIEETKRLRQ